MASTTFFTTSGTTTGLSNRVLRALGEGLARYVERQSRSGQIQRLEAKSDAELAGMGLRRDQIVRHVFRDRFFV